MATTRTMTDVELCSWVELADTGEEQAERAASANAGYPEMVLVLDADELVAFTQAHPNIIHKWETLSYAYDSLLLAYRVVPLDRDHYLKALYTLWPGPEGVPILNLERKNGLLQMSPRVMEIVFEWWDGLLMLHEVTDQLCLEELVSVFEDITETPIPIDCSRSEALYFVEAVLMERPWK
jgi:hypothetical protein